ncbi:50S ribosomal protein L15 [Blattabacterium sp. (Cryptocercus kyebangensis)]|uniref:50S ribosomal protein L15 n=1 Tax=Blattabacterium sp. (Cryptocercus kyebangensis) TaxID=298656 RepID=UPI000D7BA554|nr:50S ribosomal protein L15 [Blattabacterium sp. (Cryptocercus kyebangensis)]AWU43691.1 50S ribosomal protein L15 [Blattabacterium sp. (Cryptocercus kyebangensis)]
MELNFLIPRKGSKKKKLRLGRGQGSGKGGTCGRGHKGAKSRSGYSKKLGFEGGQMPIQRRIPKFGFRSPNRKKYFIISLDSIQELVDRGKVSNIINKQTLLDNRLLNKKNGLVKILAGRKILKYPLKITASKFSKKAVFYIQKAGGEALSV